MKKLLFFTFLSLIITISKAQQNPLYSILHENLIFFNPAMCGSTENNRVWIDHRNQWFGWKATDPYVGEAPLSNALAIEFSCDNEFINGFGAYYVYHRLGFDQINTFSIIYSKRFEFREDFSLQFGYSAEFNHIAINGKWIMGNPEPIPESMKGNIFDVGLGFLLKIKNWHIGSGFKHIMNPIADLDSGYTFQFLRTVTPFVSYKHEFGNKSYFSPICIVKIDKANILPEIDMKFSFEDRFFFSFGYRHMTNLMLTSGLQLFKSIDLLIAYEIVLTEIRKYTKDSYGVLLRYNF